MNDFQLIITVINSGFSDDVMAFAKSAGARGGTVLHARGTGDSEIARLFGISVQPEKELVLIISPTSQKDRIMQAIAKNAGITSQSNGIVFSLPISQALGLFAPSKPKMTEKDEEVQPEQTEVKEKDSQSSATETVAPDATPSKEEGKD